MNNQPELTRDYMLSELRKRECRDIYKKIDGEERDMRCTLIANAFPPLKGTIDSEPNEEVIRAFDVNKCEFRSFRVANVVSFS